MGYPVNHVIDEFVKHAQPLFLKKKNKLKQLMNFDDMAMNLVALY